MGFIRKDYTFFIAYTVFLAWFCFAFSLSPPGGRTQQQTYVYPVFMKIKVHCSVIKVIKII